MKTHKLINKINSKLKHSYSTLAHSGTKFENPKGILNNNLIIWGTNLESGIGQGRLTNIVRNSYKLPFYQRSVIIGLLLSDAWSILSQSTRKKGLEVSKLNARIGFKQSFDKFNYLFYVFNILSHYCSSYPYLTVGNRKNNITKSLTFQTRALNCFTKYHQLFYVNNKKVIPPFEEIYHLLNPIALAHWIAGDGMASKKGLVLCTDSFSFEEVIKLTNVLIIRYNFICKIRLNKENQYRIYISEKSLDSLISIVRPHMDASMIYKIIH